MLDITQDIYDFANDSGYPESQVLEQILRTEGVLIPSGRQLELS